MKRNPRMGNKANCGIQSRRLEPVFPPETAPVAVGLGVEPVDEGILDDPDGPPISSLRGVVQFTPSGKLLPSPNFMSMH